MYFNVNLNGLTIYLNLNLNLDCPYSQPRRRK